MYSKVLMLLLVVFNTTGCAGFIVASALGRNADRKEWQEKHRHQEKMRELDLQEKWMKMQQPQAPTYTTDAGIVRETPF